MILPVLCPPSRLSRPRDHAESGRPARSTLPACASLLCIPCLFLGPIAAALPLAAFLRRAISTAPGGQFSNDRLINMTLMSCFSRTARLSPRWRACPSRRRGQRGMAPMREARSRHGSEKEFFNVRHATASPTFHSAFHFEEGSYVLPPADFP